MAPDPRSRLVELLRSAYADEWIAAYNYQLTAVLVDGPGSKLLEQLFLEEVEDEIEHSRKIAARLQALGAEPPRNFQELWSTSGCKYPRLPEDTYDQEGFIKAAVEAEKCAIETYRRLYREAVEAGDPATALLAAELLRDEEEHLVELQSLLPKKESQS